MDSGDKRRRFIQEGVGQKRGDEWRLTVGFNPGIREIKLLRAMAYRCSCCGKICLDLVEGSRKRGLCLADGAALELKEGVVVMHGKGNHTQEKA